MRFAILTICGFVGMEFFSYFIHRYIFHGVLWRIHETHHVARKGWFELNDVFSLGFALVSVLLMVFAREPLVDSAAFPIGFGIAIYGLVYFVIHDFFTHRRLLPFRSDSKIFLTIRAAHQRHHQTAAKTGIEPYGLFVFNYAKFLAGTSRARVKKAKTDIVEPRRA